MEQLQGGKTTEQIEALKKKHGKVFLIEVEDPTTKQPLFFWFKKANMKALSAAATFAEEPFKMGRILFDELLIQGAKEAADDAEIFPAIVEQLSSTIKAAKAKIKEF